MFARLRVDSETSRKSPRFEELKPFLTAESDTFSYAAVGVLLGLTESAVKSAVHRLRQRFGELLREEIGQTVAAPREIDQEIRELLAVLST